MTKREATPVRQAFRPPLDDEAMFDRHKKPSIRDGLANGHLHFHRFVLSRERRLILKDGVILATVVMPSQWGGHSDCWQSFCDFLKMLLDGGNGFTPVSAANCRWDRYREVEILAQAIEASVNFAQARTAFEDKADGEQGLEVCENQRAIVVLFDQTLSEARFCFGEAQRLAKNVGSFM